MIIVFILDTSSSMSRPLAGGNTEENYLECAKAGVEHFFKLRRRTGGDNNEKYMLVTYDPVDPIKSNFKDSAQILLDELRNVQVNSDHKYNDAEVLKTVFEYLNIYRVFCGFDTPSQGRYPGLSESVLLLWFTDGGCNRNFNALDKLQEQGLNSIGSELYCEPYRWDHRMYTFLISSQTSPQSVAEQNCPLSEIMGGTTYQVQFTHLLQSYMGSLMGIPPPPNTVLPLTIPPLTHIHGVLVNFEELCVEASETLPHRADHKLIYVNPNNRHPGFFPIPESFWYDSKIQSLPVRVAHPTIYIKMKDERLIIPPGVPFDKYVIEHSNFTKELLKRPKGVCWETYIQNSFRDDGYGFPFGFLMSNSNGTNVNLYILPYNYRVLFTLIEKLQQFSTRAPNQRWMKDFSKFLDYTPLYYGTGLKSYLKTIGQQALVSGDFGTLGASIQKQLHRLKAVGKIEFDKILSKKAKTSMNRPPELPRNAFDVPRHALADTLATLKQQFFKDEEGIVMANDQLDSVDEDLVKIDVTSDIPTTTLKRSIEENTVVESNKRPRLDPPLITKPGETLNTLQPTDYDIPTNDTSTSADTPSSIASLSERDEPATSVNSKGKETEHKYLSPKVAEAVHLEIGSGTVSSAVSSRQSTPMSSVSTPPPQPTAIKPGVPSKTVTKPKPTTPSSGGTKPTKVKKESATEVKTFLMKQIRMDPKRYDENLVLSKLTSIQRSDGFTKDQKKSLINTLLTVAKGLRRKIVIEKLEKMKQELNIK
ncbi:hypothetical protein K7432_011488 [Basidiobolus ranarum]|uniref:VWFA domain-containing protein n=1 Tax=Basidiobolus ranarum TaxID=34480 RepID=A0ABR2WMC0_9FUNG